MTWTPEVLISGLAIALAVIAVAALLYRWRGRAARTTSSSRREPAQALHVILAPTRSSLLQRLQRVWSSEAEIGKRLADLEQALIAADVGVKVAGRLVDAVRMQASASTSAEDLREALRREMLAVLDAADARPMAQPCHVVLVVGVNGVGKTTTIGKLAHYHKARGRRVLLVAADTFRAAAGEQLQLWAQRIGADCVRHQSGSDPAAVVYDGLRAAVSRHVDVVIIDTAGRLHVKKSLIEELKKIHRTIGRQIDGAPHEVLLVIDAITGQNALNQARVFQEALALTGIVLTKLDGTAKGGAVFTITVELGIPVRYVGYGESPDDLTVFDAAAFVDALIEPVELPAKVA